MIQPYWQDNFRTVYNKSCTDMSELPDSSIHLCVTSPPYFNQRKYAGIQEISWQAGAICAPGNEKSPDSYVAHLIQVFREVKRVLRDDGTFWLNVGDSMAGSGQGWSKTGNKGNLGSRLGIIYKGYAET